MLSLSWGARGRSMEYTHLVEAGMAMGWAIPGIVLTAVAQSVTQMSVARSSVRPQAGWGSGRRRRLRVRVIVHAMRVSPARWRGVLLVGSLLGCVVLSR